MRIGVCCMKQFPLNWNAMRKWEWENELEKNTIRKNALLSQGFTSTNIYFSTWFRAHVHIHILMFTIRTQKQMPLAPPPSSSTTTIVTVAAALTLIFMEIPTQLWLLHHNQHVFVSQWFSMLFFPFVFFFGFCSPAPNQQTRIWTPFIGIYKRFLPLANIVWIRMLVLCCFVQRFMLSHMRMFFNLNGAFIIIHARDFRVNFHVILHIKSW